MKTFLVSVYYPDPGLDVLSGTDMLDAWTMKGARRKFRKGLAVEGVSRPELLALDTMEVAVDASTGEIAEILAREVFQL